MANIMTALKAEIARLARKENKEFAAAIRKTTSANRLALADLKKRVAALEKQLAQTAGPAKKVAAAKPSAAASAEAPAKTKGWISGKGVRSLRQRLELSQEAFARLVGVSPNGVYQWESKPGMLRLRTKTREALLAVRGLSASAAKKRLAEMK